MPQVAWGPEHRCMMSLWYALGLFLRAQLLAQSHTRESDIERGGTHGHTAMALVPTTWSHEEVDEEDEEEKEEKEEEEHEEGVAHGRARGKEGGGGGSKTRVSPKCAQ